MGKNYWKKKKKREEAVERAKTRIEVDEHGQRKPYDDIRKENADFEKYYQMQNICPPSEWNQFMDCIRESLPTTFRITGSRGPAQALGYIIENKLIKDTEIIADKNGSEEQIEKPFSLPWYPDKLAWQLNITKKDIRRSEALFKLHNFMICENESGNITRQEAVSMLPPLCLDVEPHHKVLDMCAAPGSKSAQLIEMIHAKDKYPDGVLIANDMDNKRCYMLVHQAKRLQSSAFVITNHDASLFPDLFVTKDDGVREPMKFDRVLCDVPCSGDGTIRKNVDVWKKWSPANGIWLHQTQHLILKRGLEVLDVGGLLVYSTCSLNPSENEAVVYRILKEAEGAVELVDIMIPNLKCSPGLSYWTPCSRDMKSYTSISEVKHPWINVVRDYHFPPDPAEASHFNLEKCLRILPHQQNTGAFFVALLRKSKALPWEKTPEQLKRNDELQPEAAAAEEPLGSNPPPHKLRKMHGYKEDPYVFLSEDDEMWGPLREFYGLDESLNSANFMGRTLEGKKKNIYFTTGLVRNIVKSNERRLKIINTGVKAFVRSDNKWTTCNFRLAQEGLPSLLPFIKRRKVDISVADLIVLLMNDSADHPPNFEELSEKTQDQLRSVERGSCVLVVNSSGVDGGPPFVLELIGWRGATSVRAYVSLNERMHYLWLCGGDVSRFETNKFERRAAEAEAEQKKAEQALNDESSDVTNGSTVQMEQNDEAKILTSPEIPVVNS